ncbi:MAG: putative PKS/NRPS-like protein biosynthetic cluster [Bathelium mastoideum]|nr:MAG: putative PKS/NRPS-like protein biosynthetic cluster [Bathelium mastoideum]
MRFLSPDGRCYSFDDRANGYARGEGVGCVFLKPLADALRDGDPVRAIIRNTGMNQDGKTAGITLPSQQAQEDLIRSVYSQAKINPTATSFVECHGTGTQAGDPLETAAIANVFTKNRPPGSEPLRIGSIKTNIGHLEGASGVAGLIKSVLMLEKGKILPNRNFERPSKKILFEDWNLKVPVNTEDFKRSCPSIVSVNSFGYGGTNAHAILQDTASFMEGQYKPDVYANGGAGINGASSIPASSRSCEPGSSASASRRRIFILSAFDDKGVLSAARALADFLQDCSSEEEGSFLDDLAHTLACRRTRLNFSVMVHASSKQELIDRLRDSTLRSVRPTKNAALGFIFTGQGAQWWGMGRELFYSFPDFARSIKDSGIHLKTLGADWDLQEELFKDSKSTRVHQAEISQPVCTALQVALVDLLSSWGIKPSAVTGHSSGEIAAAYCAGGLKSYDAIAAAYYRGLMSKLAKDISSVPGAMMAIGMSEAEAGVLLEDLQTGKVVTSCINSAESLTVSGDEPGIDELKAILEKRKVFARKLVVEVAYHSHHMASVAEDYLRAVSGISPIATSDSGCTFYSSVTGQEAPLSDLGPQYWVDNMVGQVKFEPAFQAMCKRTVASKDAGIHTKKRRSSAKCNITTLCEVGPHAALSGPARQILLADPALSEKGISVLSCLVRNKDAESTIADVICKLGSMGFPVDLSRFNGPSRSTQRKPKVLSTLPQYVWSHDTSLWIESRVSKEFRLSPYCRSDLIRVSVAHFNPAEPRWRNIIRASELPWIRDHKVQGSVVYPGAGFMAMAIEATAQQARQRSVEATTFELREVVIGQALVLPDDTEEVEVLLSLRPFTDSVRAPSSSWNEFTIYSVSPDNRWTEHSRGLVRIAPANKPDTVSTAHQLNSENLDIARFRKKVEENTTTTLSPTEFYSQLSDLGLDYGPTFANVKSLRCGRNTSVSSVEVADTSSVMPNAFEYPFIIHPSTLDSLFHPLFAAIGGASQGKLRDPFVPVLLERLTLDSQMGKKPGARLSTWTEARKLDDRQISAFTVVHDEESDLDTPMLCITGLTCTKLARETSIRSGQSETMIPGYMTSWMADVDEISSDGFAALCADLATDAQEEERIRALEETGYFLMKRALSQISEADVDKAYPHHKRLYNCMKAKLAESSGRYVADDAAVEELLGLMSASGAEGDLLVHVGRNLVPIVQQSRDALEVMLENGRLDAYYRDNSRFDRNYSQATRYLQLAGHKKPDLEVLEIGSGTGGATLPILQALTDKDTGFCGVRKYTFTDISTGFFEAAREKLAEWSSVVEYAKLDIEIDPLEQGFKRATYDVIVAANVLHATSSMQNTMQNVRKLLKPGGKLVLVELTRETFTTSTIFGTLSGWFAGIEEDRVRGPTLTEEKWDALLRKTGFDGLDVAVPDARSDEHRQGSMMIATASEPDVSCCNGDATRDTPASQDILVCREQQDKDSDVSAAAMTDWLRSSAPNAVVTVADLQACNPDGKAACIVLGGLSNKVFKSPSEDEFEKVKSIFTKVPAVLWVTQGALINASNPDANMVTGFARTVRSEVGNTTAVTLDLDILDTSWSTEAIQAIQALISRHILRKSQAGLAGGVLEYEYALRAGKLLIPRYIPHKRLQRSMRALLDPTASELVTFNTTGRQLVVDVGTPGLLDTIRFIDDWRLTPDLSPKEVEIDVKASGLNFKDVMMAMGQIAVETLGGECSGVIRRIGSNVNGLTLGDRVSCYGFGTFANTIRQNAAAVQKIPDEMTFELAAALPVTFCTAFYSVVHVARIQKRQSVLIHAASGGLGQALIELCRLHEAEIFCTVGTAEKKRLLMEKYGIPESHIFSSRDARFASMIMALTDGNGVDVVMNSVAGDMLQVTWGCIAPFGTFVELGARDYTINSRLEMSKFARNVTFAAVNLVSLVRERPMVAAKVWADVMHLFRARQLHGPTPLTTYSVSQLEAALRLMQGGKHIGKLVLIHNDGDLVKASPYLVSARETLFSPDASYLLVGGMGGLGRAIALWMLRNGAKNFIFASRRGLDRPEAQDLQSVLQASGARVMVCKCDVSDAADVRRLSEQYRHLPAVKGVIHGAMVLQDSFLFNMSVADYKKVVKPKVQGTWNLHELFKHDALDFFVMLSSTAGIIGNASQAAYAASSTFQDSFASYRRSRGLAASTIDLGVILGIGYVAQNQDLARALDRQGFEGTDEDGLMALLHSAILASAAPPATVETFPGKTVTEEGFFKGCEVQEAHIVTGLGEWREGSMDAFNRPIFSLFRRNGEISAGRNHDGQADNTQLRNDASTKIRLRGALQMTKSHEEASKIVCDGLIAKASSLTMTPMEEISASQPLSIYGMDSLVAVEMRNWISKEMDAAVSILELMANIPVQALAARALSQSRIVNLEP